MTETYHPKKFYRPMFTSNGNCVSYPPIGYNDKEDAKQWLKDNKDANQGYEAQITEEHFYTYQF